MLPENPETDINNWSGFEDELGSLWIVTRLEFHLPYLRGSGEELSSIMKYATKANIESPFTTYEYS